MPPTADTTAEEASAVNTHYAADIYALQYRLSRCLETIAPCLSQQAQSNSASSKNAGCSPAAIARPLRRLGELLREAKQLNARLSGETCEAGLSSNVSSNDSEDNAEDEPLRSYYDQHLRTRYAQLQQDMATAEGLLRTALASTPGLRGLPVNCVGTAPRQMNIVERDGSTHACYVYTDSLAPTAARLPAPVAYYTDRDPEAVLKRHTSSKSSVPPTENEKNASVKRTNDPTHEVPAVASASAALPPATAEDRIMADIQQAIHQMKDGALQVSAMMEQERSQMKSAAELLSGGLAKTQTEIKQLDRVSYVEASAEVPWVLTLIPGMSFLWRTVLQPLWAFLKQALLMALILAITLGVLVLITVLPKPVMFRGQRSVISAVSSPLSHPTAVHDLSLPASFPAVVPPQKDRREPSPTVAPVPADAPPPAPAEHQPQRGNSQREADDDDAVLSPHPVPREVDGDL
ncbi:hypothetical protein ABL78_0527 [Leptomonas seymouri]|uniref:Uncharacterized protein n=1 Tax=Leptomonas seymouri TaxID=5684 RepID=A0A0N1IBU0_LEPSE|nr:hypothetical protein ABL78_0527 [Leptomonas seymouri]|eukprot:KPI90301.1 hypothetical protein ABL78_0527 [Leptomonas seymouri]